MQIKAFRIYEVAALAIIGSRVTAVGQEKMMKPTFRVSRGTFPPKKLEAVRAAFAASQATLEPATRR
jgi:hypothetical protein